jgi:hypothetical protein
MPNPRIVVPVGAARGHALYSFLAAMLDGVELCEPVVRRPSVPHPPPCYCHTCATLRRLDAVLGEIAECPGGCTGREGSDYGCLTGRACLACRLLRAWSRARQELAGELCGDGLTWP